jgi:RNA polymerase-associated protein CTR9
LGRAEPDKIRREEHFYHAESLLSQAALIKQATQEEEPEQMPVVGRAHLELARGNPIAAEKLLDSARNMKDDGLDNIGPMLWKALMLYRRGQVAEALQWYKRALRTHPGAPPSVRLGIGACQLRLGDFTAARAAFTRALNLDPDNPDALLGLALVELNAESAVPPGLIHDAADDDDEDEERSAEEKLLDARRTYGEAIDRGLKLLERAFHLDPHNPAVNVALAGHFLYSGDADAVEHLTESLVRGAGGGVWNEVTGATPRLRAEAAYARGRLHHSRGELGRAQALYMAATQLDDAFAAPTFGLAQVALARGDAKSAMAYAERAYRAYPNSVPVMRIYGHLRRMADAAAAVTGGGGLVSVGRSTAAAAAAAAAPTPVSAATVLKRVVDADPMDLEARLEHGDALLAAGDYTGALAAYETATKIIESTGAQAGSGGGNKTVSKTGGGGGAPPAALLNNCAVLRAMTMTGRVKLLGHDKARGLFLRALEAAAAEEDAVAGTGPRNEDEDAARQSGAALDAPAARRSASGSALPVAFNLARLAEERGEVADAGARYGDLLAAAPGMTECLLRRAEMAARRENFEAATELARDALAVRPGDPDAMAYVGHLLMRQGRWAEAQAQFKLLRAAPKVLGATAAQLSAAAGKDPGAATHQHDEYAMLSLANAAYYQAVKLQSSANLKRGDPKVREAEQAHLDYAATLYTKALQKSGSDLFAANGLGILLAERGRIDEAKVTFQMVSEGISAGGAAGTEGDAAASIGGDANSAARDRLMTSPDIWINQGHIQMAKGNHVAAARHYEQAQSSFFFNLDHRVMLYQARNSYEEGSLEASKSALRRALHVAPWNHRLRFNLAYVLQESAHRTLNRTLKGAEKGQGAGAGVGSGDAGGEATGRLQQVLTAIDEFKLALQLFEQLQKIATGKAAASSAVGAEDVAAAAAAKLAPEYGFDKKRVGIHVQFCAEALRSSQPHLEAAEREEAALQARRDAQAAARKAAEDTRAAATASRDAAEELKRRAAEAAAAAAAERFKQSQDQWMRKAASSREVEDAAEGRGNGGKGAAGDFVDDDDDDILQPDAGAGRRTGKSAEEKAKLKAAGLESDSDEDDDDVEDPAAVVADEDDAAAKAKLKV